MKIKLKEQTIENTISLAIAGVILIAFYFFIQNFSVLQQFLNQIVSILFPFLAGFSIAFLLTPIVNRAEQKWLAKTKLSASLKRKIAVFIGILFMILILIGFMAILIPQLWVSVNSLSMQLTSYLSKANELIQSIMMELGFAGNWFTVLFSSGEKMVQGILDMLSNYLPRIIGYSWYFLRLGFDFVIAVIIAVYILVDKERFTYQFKKLFYAILPQRKVEMLIDISRLTSKMFNSFIIGKLIDSLIIGIICFVGMLVMRLPFAVLISFIVGLTNMIPVFGPFIGAVPGIFILFIVDPILSLIFAVFVLLLQQFDGNILGPLILGDTMGLPSLWVMFAIIVGGGFFGVLGMFLGVPIFAVFYVIVKSIVTQKLTKKNITTESMK